MHYFCPPNRQCKQTYVGKAVTWEISQITLLPISNFWVFPIPDFQIHAKSPFDSLKSESVSLSVVSHSLQPSAVWPVRLLCLWDFPAKNTGVGCHALLQGIFLTQEQHPCLLCLLHCREILYQLGPHWSPLIPSLFIKIYPQEKIWWINHLVL